MITQKKRMLEASFNNCDTVRIDGKNFVINELTEQIPATRPELLKEAAERLISMLDMRGAQKIIGEEDKGGILVAAVSLLTGLPFGLARWYPSGLADQISVDFQCEYAEGKLFLNGVQPGDRVVIVEDMISTGGTMISLIKAVEMAGATILDVVAVVEKEEYHGSERIEKETGIRVKSLLKLSVEGVSTKVASVSNGGEPLAFVKQVLA